MEHSTTGPLLMTRVAFSARRALAVLALLISLASLVSVLVAPAHPASLVPAPSGVLGLGPLPQLCSACGLDTVPWVGPDHPAVTAGAAGDPQVDPMRLAAAASAAPPDRRFGIVEAFRAPFAAAYAGIGWERVNFDWPSLQPAGPDSWNRAAVSGAMIEREIASGREIVGIIGGRPQWAIDAHGLPRGLYLPANSPRNLFGAFVASLVRRYLGRIKHWIVWNEPDVWDANVRGYTWPGTVDDFARLVKVAYVQIKSVDPTLVVHLAATTYWWDAAYGRPLYFARLLDALARDPNARAHNWYFDVASAHVYDVPDDIERILRLDRSLMQAHGFDKPIWLVETNATPTQDGSWKMTAAPWSATPQEQAAFVAQAVSLALAAGAERVSFYKMADPANMPSRAYPIGLVRPDGSARPVIAALRATTHALAGWVGATDLGTQGQVRAVAVDRAARGGTLVLWNNGIDSVQITVSVPMPQGSDAATADTRIALVADDDTRLPTQATMQGAQALINITLQAGRCARDAQCHDHLGGAPIMVVAPAMPRLAG